MRKATLIQEARNKGIEVSDDATMAQIRDLMEKGESDALSVPRAGAAARSLDDDKDDKVFRKIYVLDGDYDEVVVEDLKRDVVHQARQVGLTATSEVKLTGKETRKHRRGVSTRVEFAMDVELTADVEPNEREDHSNEAPQDTA